MNSNDEKRQIEFSIGYVLKLAEAGKTLDQVERFKLSKQALSSKDRNEPEIARHLYRLIYSKTRNKIRSEALRAKAGKKSLIWQGLRNPITRKSRLPFSLGAKNTNVENATMTPAQANFVELLSRSNKIKDYKKLQKLYKNDAGVTEFIRDPMVFNSRAGRLTEAGKRDFKKAFKYVHGYELDDDYLETLTDKLFGTHAGFDGAPHIFIR